MAPGNNHFPKADILVGLVSLCVGAVVCFSITRNQGYFSQSTSPAGSTKTSGTQDKTRPIEKDSEKPLPKPDQLSSAARALKLFDRAREEEEAGNREAAIKHYREACNLDPICKGYWSALGSACLLDNQFDNGHAAYMRVYNLDVYDIFNLNRLGFVCQSMRRDDEASRWYLMALAIMPNNQDAWNEMYNLSHGQNLQAFSEEIHQASLSPLQIENPTLVYKLNQAGLDDNPDDYYYIVNRAFMDLQFMRLTSVQADVDKALRIDKSGPAALLARAQLYSFRGEMDKAIQAYKDCLAVSPQPFAYAELGAIEMQEGHLDEAFHDYGKASELGNDKPSWATTFGKLRVLIDERDRQARQAKGNKTSDAKAAAVHRGPAAGGPDVSAADVSGTHVNGRSASDAK